jgi:DNA invertase Pin-like site-specific DNA recombinase
MRVAIYARVSTSAQDTENQVKQLLEYAARMEWEVISVLRETEHGWEPDREKLKELMGMAARREIDIVLVWAMDRFSRQGVRPTLQLLEQLNSYGVTFWSYREEFLRALDPRVAELILSVLAWSHQQQYLIIRERVKAGLERAKANGAQLGRPITLTPDMQPAVVKLRSEGRSWKQISVELGLPPTSVRKLYALAQI